MQIHGTSHVHGPQGINGPHFNRAGRTNASQQNAAPTGDRLDISPAAEAAIQASEGSDDIRADLVARIKSEIAAGTYETEGKLESAIDRFLDQTA